MQLVLPQLIVGDTENVNITLECEDFAQLYETLQEKYPDYLTSIFNENRTLKKGVFLVMDGQIVKKYQVERLTFTQSDVLEVLVQLLGNEKDL